MIIINYIILGKKIDCYDIEFENNYSYMRLYFTDDNNGKYSIRDNKVNKIANPDYPLV